MNVSLSLLSVNYVRQKLFNSLDIPVNQYATLVHPSAIVSSSAKIECGTVVMPHAVINADTTIGKHSLLTQAQLLNMIITLRIMFMYHPMPL